MLRAKVKGLKDAAQKFHASLKDVDIGEYDCFRVASKKCFGNLDMFSVSTRCKTSTVVCWESNARSLIRTSTVAEFSTGLSP